MARKIAYWISTVIVGLMLLSALSYLTRNQQVVSGFAKAGYPQHLRTVLGIAKPAAAIILLLPGFALLKNGHMGGGFRVGDGVPCPRSSRATKQLSADHAPWAETLGLGLS